MVGLNFRGESKYINDWVFKLCKKILFFFVCLKKNYQQSLFKAARQGIQPDCGLSTSLNFDITVASTRVILLLDLKASANPATT